MSAAEVWVVDDDRSIRWVLEKALGRSGISVRCFENGRQVLDRLPRERPATVVTDVRMPETDGFTLLDANGAGTASLTIPRIRALSGLRLYTGFAVIDTMAGTVDDFSTTFTFGIE